MKWERAELTDIEDEIATSVAGMSEPQFQLWEAMKIPPRKWRELTMGDPGEGFWVVGLIGSTVLWYNDIEEGFNHSKYAAYGTIDTYACEQDSLNLPLQHILDDLAGARSAQNAGKISMK